MEAQRRARTKLELVRKEPELEAREGMEGGRGCGRGPGKGRSQRQSWG